jgi:hypothetical protein
VQRRAEFAESAECDKRNEIDARLAQASAAEGCGDGLRDATGIEALEFWKV